ncbi:MAG: HsdR family type I site-specific deoxyribonuclease [Defluviitaleaceae bacterium]|nr:HsdR family type I site-specific deoxyribonuclease [Defluviitaleaceae bacterium]
MFNRESDFEEALVQLLLADKGWEEVIANPTEQDLINNWAKILYENNRDIDKLNDQPLTDGEMAQIIGQINSLKTPLRLNGFINGKSVSITRDNPADTLHFGKEVSLKIYDRHEIAAGQSRYQIARQPKFPTKGITSDRRGDLMLLINGMPVFHIELKKSGIPVSQATNQIEHYAKNGIFTGLFSLVQIFVAMTPDDTVYFANPGPEGRFNPDFYFNWADFNNEPIKDWKSASLLISIPMAHQIIGFYTVADTADGVLKVMRSYQYYAAYAISDRVERLKWGENNLLGGYIWHTTGSGKTMTSFKSAQLIASSKFADKVVFLMDRIELGTQSLEEYQAFANDDETVQGTKNSLALLTKLKSNHHNDTLIVTSIQKMSQIKEESKNASDIEIIGKKRIVIIVDEAHRSTFGDMLRTIKDTFPHAVFFGFTGTPIHDENRKKDNTTSDVFGNELHRYSIADGIRDKNVLGFDPDMVSTFTDKDVRTAVALDKAKAVGSTNEEKIKDVFADPKKKKIYDKYMSIPMAGYYDANNDYIKGIEDFLPNEQYNNEIHRGMVVTDILDNWLTLSQNGKFHAIFATHSILQAIEYYRLLKARKPDLKISALFDPNVDFDENPENSKFKEDGLVEIITDYNERFFGQKQFDIKAHGKFKKDLAARLAHKDAYKAIERTPEKQLDILIVVDQMLTGFDSKWVNTLYMDKVMWYAEIIQAFSRTNRLFGPDKPFGTIRYYRRPHTMKRNIADAVKLYSGDKPFDLFVDKLEGNIKMMNIKYEEIRMVFASAGVPDFSRLPNEKEARGKFAKLFKELTAHLEAATIQGFKWVQTKYEMLFDEQTYLILALRYKELFGESSGGGGDNDAPYELEGYLTEIDTGMIDNDYMNSRFEKYLKTLDSSDERAKESALNDLHTTFATLTQEEQRYANIFLRDVGRGDVVIEDGKTLRDYITDYQMGEKNAQIKAVAAILGLDEALLHGLFKHRLTEANINEFGRFDKLIASVDREKARAYFETVEGAAVSAFATSSKASRLLRGVFVKG